MTVASWTALVGTAMRARVARRSKRLADEAYWRAHTMRLQHEALAWLLRRAQGTSFGKAHGFRRIAAIGDQTEQLAAYRTAVPVVDWYAFKDDLERMRLGAEPDVLWPGLVGHFAQTSGTTAGDKFIPVSKEMFRSNYRASLDIFGYMLGRGLSLERIMSGRCLFLGGSSDLRRDDHGIVTADLSGLVTPLIRWPLSAIYSPGPEIALISDWPTKIERMARLALDQDIRFLSGMPSWAHVLMTRVLELAREQGDGASCIRDVWPNLEIFVHGGVRYAPFERRLGEVVTGDPAGDFPHRHELYPASEGFVAMQDRVGRPGMRMLADIGNFYEFLPVEDLSDDGSIPPNARTFTADAVEPGVRYCVIMSTCAGLWRYNIGDVVEFDDVPAALGGRGGTGPARLRIVGRHRHFINAFGENLIVEHIEDAVAAAASELGLGVGEFTAAPVYPAEGMPAGMELVIELPVSTDQRDQSRLRDLFDDALQRINVDYATKRTADMGMAPPTLTRVEPGTFHAWMASRGKLGGQHKCPRCANHRDYVEGVRSASDRPNSTRKERDSNVT